MSRDRDVRADEVELDRFRDEDLSGAREIADALRDGHGQPHDIVGSHLDLTGVDTGSEL